MSSSVGKRQRERQKLDRAQVKAERRAVRRAAGAEDADTATLSPRSEVELIDELRALQQVFEDDGMSTEDFEVQRNRIRAELERISL